MRFHAATLIVIALGLAIGIGSFTFGYARGYSYLLDDSAACANCHVMRDQYEGWLKSAHREVASCNDCHTPAGALPKYAVKAINGFNHSLAFTTGRFHEPIRANQMNRNVARRACWKCHASIADSMHAPPAATDDDESLSDDAAKSSEEDCTRCHGSVGHPF